MFASDRDRTRAARLLARVVPSWEDRTAAARGAGLVDVQVSGEPEAAWRLLIDEALLQGRMVQLGRAALARKPDDPALQRLARGIDEARIDVGVGVLPWIGAGFAALGGIVLAVVFVAAGPAAPAIDDAPRVADLPGAEAVPEAERLPVGAADHMLAEGSPAIAHEAAGDAAGEVAEAPASEPAQAEPVAAVAPPEPAAEPVAERAPVPEPVAAPVVRSPVREAPRAAEGGERPQRARPGGACVGYAYMGASTDLGVGDVWVVPEATNVRAAYPSADNGWSARSPRQCVLARGQRLRLGEAPMPILGGAVWVRVDAAWIED